ncbi:MocR-like pyridoxine biosynthesis transcription factor PdxR [Sphingobium sp. YR768]|uniref:MocR-like pyridoxine biosynthesis transcription factor PdxR n=1 Tax=Sphingobium sp. YR768 TaxID=1884365 RepID=UPI0008AB8004|nr:PLP-dependent aminotransferase family protein [Sphingobium sp. YR768]SER33900.1 GntR family transcriptional regulator / MocR family aminotransferase [Sphingobium sp. YR768]
MAKPWTVLLRASFRDDADLPRYMQIAHGLIHEIERGRLLPGEYLPSSRDLATALAVNRKTIVTAYEELIAQGWLVSGGTRGTMVSTSLPSAESIAPAPLAAPFGDTEYPFLGPPDRPIAIAPGTWRKLDEGVPDGRLFPADPLARAYRKAVEQASRDNGLGYRDPRGLPRLRQEIAEMLRRQRGLMVTADHICITRGSQMGVFLTARVLIRPGDAVLVERLTHEPAVAAFRACGAKIVTVGLDEDGIDVADVERQCRRHRVRAIFVTPHHQFPTTVSMRPERRLRLLELARQFAFAVIEDDYDHEFHFGAQPLLPMASYAPARVIYAGSMSKLLVPALRIGYIAAAPQVIDALAYQISLIDGMGNSVTEDAAAELLATGEVRRHVRKTAQIYAARRDAFARSLEQEMADLVDYRLPDGGLAFWLRFRDIAALDRMEARAPEFGLSFASSHSYAADDSAERGLRIGFASLTEEEAREVLRTLRRCADK